MGKVSTTDKKESIKTGKEFIGKEFYREINKLKPIKIYRCAYCKDIIKLDSINYNYNKYCSQWCDQQDSYYHATIKKIKKQNENKQSKIIKVHNE